MDIKKINEMLEIAYEIAVHSTNVNSVKIEAIKAYAMLYTAKKKEGENK